MTDDRTRLSGMLNFAAEILAARETVRFDMATGGGMVLREEAVAHLPGIHLAEEEAWMRVVRMRETAPPALPERFQDWLDGTITHPDRPPRLHDQRMVQVTIETASELVEAGLAAREACHPIQEDDPETGEIRIGEREVLVQLELDRLEEFRAAFEEWVTVAWTPWAEEELPPSPVDPRLPGALQAPQHDAGRRRQLGFRAGLGDWGGAVAQAGPDDRRPAGD